MPSPEHLVTYPAASPTSVTLPATLRHVSKPDQLSASDGEQIMLECIRILASLLIMVPLRPRVLGDRVRLDADDLAALDPVLGAEARGSLELLDVGLVGDGAGADGDVVALGEHPPVEVRRDVVADVHLGALLVVLHLVVGDPDALLERDGVLVVAGAHVLGDAGVGAVRAHDRVHLERPLLAAGLAVGAVVVVVVHHVRAVEFLGRLIPFKEQRLHGSFVINIFEGAFSCSFYPYKKEVVHVSYTLIIVVWIYCIFSKDMQCAQLQYNQVQIVAITTSGPCLEHYQFIWN
uniref:Uncharacterized protein n=1 Tax=Oryza brachyantha TaxID=4533 RepID=J3LH13_ORYBR